MNILNSLRNRIWAVFEKSCDKIGTNSDNRLERFELSNELNVLLVQNKNFQNSSVLMTIDAGGIYDPEDFKGLAHLTQHLIFQESDKYKGNNEFKSLLNQNSGNFNGLTSLEDMKFYIQIDHINFEKACDILAHALARPVLNDFNVYKEINVSNQEFQIAKNNPNNLFASLFNSSLDQSLSEPNFFARSKDILSHPNIVDKVSEFHKKYFTSNRMQLVIAGNSSLKNLKEIAKLFNIIPKAKLRLGADIIKNLKFNDKYEISTLSEEYANIDLSQEFSNSIVKFNMKNNLEILFIWIKLPSELSYFENRSSEYICDYFNKNIPKLLIKDVNGAKLTKDISISCYSLKRFTFYSIRVDLTSEGKNKTSLIFEKIHKFFSTHKINKKLFDLKREEAKMLFKEPVDSLESVNMFGTCLNRFSHHNLKKYFTEYTFNEKVINESFEKICDRKNWTVFQFVDDSSLPNKNPLYQIQYSNPFPLNWEAAEVVKKAFSEKTKKISWYIRLKRYFLPVYNKQLICGQLENGEYCIMYEDKVCKNECDVSISFFTKYELSKTLEAEIFLCALFNRVKTLLNEKKLQNYFFVNRLGIMDGKIRIAGKKEQVLKSLSLISDELKYFKPNENELQQAKIDYEILCSTISQAPSNVQMLDVLTHIIKDVQFNNCKKDLCENAKFYTDYYLKIQSLGNIDEEEIFLIYNQFKSTGTKSLIQKPVVSDKRVEFQILDEEDQSVLFAYNIPGESSYKKSAICSILKSLLINQFHDFFRSENQVSCIDQVSCHSISLEFFLFFLLKTKHDLSKIETIFMKFMKNYQEIIKKMTEAEFEAIKFGICKNINISSDSIDGLVLLFDLFNLFGEYDFDFVEKLKKTINLITKEDLLNLNLAKAQPIVISTGKNVIKKK